MAHTRTRSKDAFVNADTTIAEVGSIKVVTANGTCLSCDSQAVASLQPIPGY